MSRTATTVSGRGRGFASMTAEQKWEIAGIEIKVVKIGKRQLKPGLFKQIRMEKILDFHTDELLGTPLFRVEYHFGCEYMRRADRYSDRTHVHVLWLNDANELRHALQPLGDNVRDLSPWADLLELEQIYI